MGEASSGTSGTPEGKTWRERFIKQHYRKILVQIIFFPIVPFVFVLVQAIIWPGLIYCNDEECPRSFSPSIPDAVTIPIVLVIYIYCILLSLAITFSSGAWMRNAFRNKLIVITTIFLMGCSIFQMSAPAGYRGYAITYRSVQQYNFNITRTGNNEALLQVSNLWGEYLNGRNVLVEVREIGEDVDNLQSVSPLSKVVFKDSTFDQTTEIRNGTLLNRELSNLKSNTWYLFSVIPAYKAVGTAAIGSYLLSVSSITTNIGDNDTTRIFEDAFLDLRSFKTCKWDQDNGCEGGFH